jgi:hypothetical protein
MLVLLLLAATAVGPSPAAAADLTVTDCGDTTPGGAPGQLRKLINDAAPGDTIIVPACLIVLTGPRNEDANVGGDLDITKNLTIRGAGGHATVIDGGLNDRIFDIITPIVLPPSPPLVNVTIEDLMVRRGFGDTRGGGIRNGGNLTLNRVVIRGNFVTGALEAGGAGIANHGVVNAVEIAVENNSGSGPVLQSGGGIHNVSDFTLTRSTVAGNVVVGAEFFSNSGAISNSGNLTIIDSTITSNDGAADGPGGIFSTGTLTVTGSAILSNFSVSGVNGIITTGIATLTNSIVGNNAIPGGGSQCAGLVNSGGGNLGTDNSCATGGPSDAVAANLGLGPLGPHGGPTNTHPLLPGSPAIDTGLPAPCTATDQRGMPRPQDGNGDAVAVCDKGPFEFTPPVFVDVPATHAFRGAIEALLANGITSGCGVAPPSFCPDDPVTRAQLAVFILKVLEGPGFVPPPAVGIFADVPIASVFAPWIEELFNRGITSGCGVAPLIFCPNDSVTRTQLSIIILRGLTVPGFVPPAAVGVFVDVPAGSPPAPFIEEFFRRGVTAGCQDDPLAFCPSNPATRGQIAAFLVRAFGFGF